MMEPITIARPYARAAFEVASASGVRNEWLDKLVFAAQVAAEPRIVALFGDPRVPANVMTSLFVRGNEASDATFGRFLGVLAENGRLRELPEIAALFEQMKRDAENVLNVRVRSAVAMDDAEVARLVKALKRRFGRDIELERTVDPTMLGGAVIDAGESVIDGSLRGRLAKLEAALTS
jgi:F-type H+-transporting ATPase subunit delta